MSDSPVLDGGARFPEVMSLRLPAGFLARIRAAAAAEGIAPQDFTRRAIAERIARSTAPGGTRDTETPERHDHGEQRAGTPRRDGGEEDPGQGPAEPRG